MADYAPVYAAGQLSFSKTASATTVGGNVVVASGVSTVAPAGGAPQATVVGVAGNDAASGARVTVWPLTNLEHEIIVGTGTVTAGEGVVATTAGTVITAPTSTAAAAAAGTLIGIATTTATAPNKVRFVGRS